MNLSPQQQFQRNLILIFWISLFKKSSGLSPIPQPVQSNFINAINFIQQEEALLSISSFLINSWSIASPLFLNEINQIIPSCSQKPLP